MTRNQPSGPSGLVQDSGAAALRKGTLPADRGASAAPLAHCGLLLVSPRGLVEYGSAAACALLDADPAQLNGQRLDAVIPALSLGGKTPGHNLAQLISLFPEGRWHTVDASACGGRAVRLEVSTLLIATAGSRKLLVTLRPCPPAAERSTDLQKLLAALHDSAEVAVITDTRGIIEYVNPAYERITGFTAAEALGQTQRILRSGIHPPSFYRELWATVLGGKTHRAVFANRARDGALFYLEEELRPFFDQCGQITHFVSIGRDVSGDVALRETLHQRANFDSLTGVANRYLLIDRLHREITRARRERGRFTVLYADIDGFKAINDCHGHPAGDAVLCAVSECLSRSVREMDTVGRLGGDEFFLILPGMFRHADVEALVGKILEGARRVRIGNGLPFPVSLSVGAASYPEHGSDDEALIQAADAAMYEAKRRGGDGHWMCSMDSSPRQARATDAGSGQGEMRRQG